MTAFLRFPRLCLSIYQPYIDITKPVVQGDFMLTIDHDITGGFMRNPCPDCNGVGELRLESENINENFEVEKQIVITACPRCGGTGTVMQEDEKTVQGGLH
jgi:hypothetical protein